MEQQNFSFDWVRGCGVDFDLKNGLSKLATPTQRRLSQMKHMFYDVQAVENRLKEEDPVIYEFYELGVPETPGHLSFGTSITYPGTIGNEYYMTKGHFHTILETAEVYYCLSGEGFLLMENPEGDVQIQPLSPGVAVYVPPRYAHRSINTGSSPLVTFFVFAADAGHDYGSIESTGYRKLIFKSDAGPNVVDNPKYADVPAKAI